MHRLAVVVSGYRRRSVAMLSSIRWCTASKPPSSGSASNPQRAGVAEGGADDSVKPVAAEEYRFPTQDVMNAVKAGEFAKVQSHASKLVEHKWREEYTLPAACIVVFVIAWYWMAWTRRSVRRKCDAMEAAVRQEADQTVEKVKALTEQWRRDIDRANTQMKGIIDKNSQLTADIDRMTTALRSCSIRPTPNAAPHVPPATQETSTSASEEKSGSSKESRL